MPHCFENEYMSETNQNTRQLFLVKFETLKLQAAAALARASRGHLCGLAAVGRLDTGYTG